MPNIIPKPKFNKAQHNKDYYQKHQEAQRVARMDRYWAKKKAKEKALQKLVHPLYNAQSIKILLTLKDYTELSPEKKKLFADFAWTFNDLKESGFTEIAPIQKLELLAGNLRRDYYATAKIKLSNYRKHWNNLTEEQQNRLISYWAREKHELERELTNELTTQSNLAAEYEAEIKQAKFHEERGKVNCECWQCQAEQTNRKEAQENIDRFFDKPKPKPKLQCSECGKLVKWLDEENDICKSCLKALQG